VRGVVLLANDTNGDLWEWNGSAWRMRASVQHPTSSTGRAFAFDRARGVAVLATSVGGRSTWEWNGTAWRQSSSSDPADIEAAAFVPARGRVVGVAGRDLYEWTGVAWVLLASAIIPSAPNA